MPPAKADEATTNPGKADWSERVSSKRLIGVSFKDCSHLPKSKNMCKFLDPSICHIDAADPFGSLKKEQRRNQVAEQQTTAVHTHQAVQSDGHGEG